MHAESEFLAHIREAPDDDAPRLIFADWLDEQNDWRATLIRKKCASREMKTIMYNAHSRIPDVGVTTPLKYSALVTRARGFVESVNFAWEDWSVHGPIIVLKHPIQNVWLIDKLPHTIVGGGDFDQYCPESSWAAEDDDSPLTGKAQRLPNEVFDLLQGGMKGRGRWRTYYPTDEESCSKIAMKALSKACVEWALRKAGLK